MRTGEICLSSVGRKILPDVVYGSQMSALGFVVYALKSYALKSVYDLNIDCY